MAHQTTRSSRRIKGLPPEQEAEDDDDKQQPLLPLGPRQSVPQQQAVDVPPPPPTTHQNPRRKRPAAAAFTTPPTAHAAPKPTTSFLHALLLPTPPSSPPAAQRPRPTPSPSTHLAAALLSLLLRRSRASLFGASLAMLYACNHLPFESPGTDMGEGFGDEAVVVANLSTLDGRLEATLGAVLAILSRAGVTADRVLEEEDEDDDATALAALWVVEGTASTRRSSVTRAAFWYACAGGLLLGLDDQDDDGEDDGKNDASGKTRRRLVTERFSQRLKPRLVARQRFLLEACGWRAAIVTWGQDVEPALEALRAVRFVDGGEEQEEVAWWSPSVSPLEAARRLVREEAGAYTRAHARMKAEDGDA